jgi:hypothetical protein
MTTEPVPGNDAALQVRRLSRHALAGTGLRLAAALQGLAAAGTGPADAADTTSPGRGADLRTAADQAQAFARQHAARVGLPLQPGAGAMPAPGLAFPAWHPLGRLLALVPASERGLACDLLLLACLPQAHEGFAALCARLHREGLPEPGAALALAWLEHEADHGPGPGPAAGTEPLRERIETLLLHSPFARLDALRLHGSGPWHGRSLRPGPGLWTALTARLPAEGDGGQLVTGLATVPGLDAWLAEPAQQLAVQALARGADCRIALLGGDSAMRATRMRALLGAARVPALRASWPGTAVGPASAALVCPDLPVLTAWLHGAALWLAADDEAGAADGPGSPGAAPWAAPDAADILPRLPGAGPWLQSAASAAALPPAPAGLPLLTLAARALGAAERRTMWLALLGRADGGATALRPDAAALDELAARYPIEPDEARAALRDAQLAAALAPPGAAAPSALDPTGLAPLCAAIRRRAAWSARPGVQRIAPQVGLQALRLPAAALAQLDAARQRVARQLTVLDDWGFAQGRSGRRGVRLLFSGPPGTGKTLAAEALAHALGIEMLVVDLAALVSKWLGETEKNLAAVFDRAERARALLLFDEADALFGRRTEGRDAHDRWANLETAYLLQRLERFEGVAVLTTNLRGQIDPAFTRRFEHIVDFPEPDAAAREALWRLHLPPQAPRAADLALDELAAWYALSGAQIRNAALAAAFLAAGEGALLAQRHLLAAIEREFTKAGRAHPGRPPPRAPARPAAAGPTALADGGAGALRAQPQPVGVNGHAAH